MVSRKLFHELIDPHSVVKILNKFVDLRPSGVEEVSISEAFGRVLAEDVRARYDSPPFDRSEVDGYAVVSESVAGADEDSPATLKVVGKVGVGEEPLVEVGLGEAVEVDTGAVIPRGADAVVMAEYTKELSNGRLLVFKSITSGENIARAGSDIARGEVVLRKGTIIGAAEIASLAAAGISKVRVYRKVRAGIISIGNELRPPGNSLRIGEVFDVNAYSISASLRELGCDVATYGIIPDNEDKIKEVVKKALKENDIVITSGGTSAGIKDLTYRVLNELGRPGVIIHGVKLKPGKPTVVAVINNKVVIGLPGFPLSAMMSFKVVAIPIISRLMGVNPSLLKAFKVRARLARRLTGVKGRNVLVPVALNVRPGSNELLAYPVRFRSGSIHVLTYADGFIEVREDTGIIEAGTFVNVELFRGNWVPPSIVCIGSHDYLMETILYEYVGSNELIKYVPAGSMGGLTAVSSGEADVGGTHILDEETNEYNIPIIKKLGMSGKVRLVRGWIREIGLVIPKGNPKGIKGLEDLLRDDVLFINRNKGSGTRVLIDMKLKEIAKRRGIPFNRIKRVIKGYWNEVRTHTAVAAAVSQGRADVGVAIKWAAKLYGLDFIKIGDEIYDIAINRESLSKDCIKRLVEFLGSNELKKVVKRFEGYRLLKNSGEFIL